MKLPPFPPAEDLIPLCIGAATITAGAIGLWMDPFSVALGAAAAVVAIVLVEWFRK